MSTKVGYVKHEKLLLNTFWFFTDLEAPKGCTVSLSLTHTHTHTHTSTHTHTHAFLGVSCCDITRVVDAKEAAATFASVHLVHCVLLRLQQYDEEVHATKRH